jgi:hypothetical protein
MPRGSLPGERRGGRQRGTPNKKTALRNAAITAALKNPDILPLDFFRSQMANADLPLDRRIMAAEAALPFVHSKPAVIRPDPPSSIKYGEPAPRVKVRLVPVAATTETPTPSAAGSEGNGQHLSPLDFLLGLMRDAETPPQLRDKVAHIVAPYVHAKLKPSPRPPNAFVVDDQFGFVIDPAVAKALMDDHWRLCDLERTAPSGREIKELQASTAARRKALVCPPGYTWSDVEKDSDRIGHFGKKRRAPAPHNKLTAEEEAEEAHIWARRDSHANSAEAIEENEVTERIFELNLKCFSRDRSPDHHREILNLWARYPRVAPRPENMDYATAYHEERIKRFG